MLTERLLESEVDGFPPLTGEGVARVGEPGALALTGCTIPSAFLMIKAALFLGGTMKSDLGAGLLVTARLAEPAEEGGAGAVCCAAFEGGRSAVDT